MWPCLWDFYVWWLFQTPKNQLWDDGSGRDIYLTFLFIRKSVLFLPASTLVLAWWGNVTYAVKTHWPSPLRPPFRLPATSFFTATISQATSFCSRLLHFLSLSRPLSLPVSLRFGIDFSQLMKLKRQHIVCGVAHGDEFCLRVHDTGFRGEFLWGGLNRSPLSPPPSSSPRCFLPSSPLPPSPLLPCLSHSQKT